MCDNEKGAESIEQDVMQIVARAGRCAAQVLDLCDSPQCRQAASEAVEIVQSFAEEGLESAITDDRAKAAAMKVKNACLSPGQSDSSMHAAQAARYAALATADAILAARASGRNVMVGRNDSKRDAASLLRDDVFEKAKQACGEATLAAARDS